MTDRCKNITLLQTLFAGGKYLSMHMALVFTKKVRCKGVNNHIGVSSPRVSCKVSEFQPMLSEFKLTLSEFQPMRSEIEY